MNLLGMIQRWRIERSIRNLNGIAAIYGREPMSKEEWIAVLERAAPIVRMAGVSAADASAGFKRLAAAARLRTHFITEAC